MLNCCGFLAYKMQWQFSDNSDTERPGLKARPTQKNVQYTSSTSLHNEICKAYTVWFLWMFQRCCSRPDYPTQWRMSEFPNECSLALVILVHQRNRNLVIIKSQAELRSCTHRISPFSPWSWTIGFSASTLVSPVGASPAAPGDDTQATRRSTKNVWRGKSEENVSSARVVWVQCWKRVWCWHDTTERKLTWNGTTTPQRYPSNLWGVPCEEFSILFSLSPGVGQLPKPGLRMMCTPQARLQHHRRPQSPAKFQKRSTSPNIQKHPHIPEKMLTNHQIFPRSLMIFKGQWW